MRPSFDRLDWHEDRVLLDDLVFRFEQCLDEDFASGDECFRLYKRKGLIDQYERFFALHDDVEVRSILELGIWDGGSIAFWNEMLHPDKHVGVDLDQDADSAYFEHYVRSRGLEDRVSTFRGVDQADADALRAIVDAEFTGPLDLVIDDASHEYVKTKASFETLFPLLRTGGLYIIEDWAWAHWDGYQHPRHRWIRDEALTTLIVELIEALGSSTDIIVSATTFQGFAVIERGRASIDDPDGFVLSTCITRRPKPGRGRRLRLRRRLARLRQRWSRAGA